MTNERTKEALLASFYAASRIARGGAALTMTAASAAGLLLHLGGGSVTEAIRLGGAMPIEEVWIVAIGYLTEIEDRRHGLRVVEGGR